MTIRRTGKELVAVAAATVLAATTLGACASTAGNKASSESGESGSASDNVSVWVWPGAMGDSVASNLQTSFKADNLQVSVIGDNFKQKLITTFTSKSNIPTITGIKGEDMPYFLQESSLFTDFKTLGVDDLISQFPQWKLAEATTSDGQLIGLPTDIGPTVLFYRTDVLEEAGLPTDPEAVAEATSTWDKYFEFGKKLKATTGANLTVSMGEIFTMSVAQSGTGFVDRDGNFIGDSQAIKTAWSNAVTAYEDGLDAGIEDGSTDWSSAINNGTIPTVLGAAWHAGDIKTAAPDTSGKWRVTSMPGGPANVGGSFLTIPAATTDKATAVKVVRDILSPENLATSYTEVGNYPASSAALKQSALTGGDSFFGGQVTSEVFEKAIASMPTTYTSPYDAQVQAPFLTELTNIESQHKDPNTAWNDAVASAKQALENAK